MTIVESIKCVLQQNNDGLTSKQIYDEIIRQGLYSFGAENPVGVVNAQLRRRCIGLDFPTAYPIKFFEIAGYEGKKIKFRLISTENTATISSLSNEGLFIKVAEIHTHENEIKCSYSKGYYGLLNKSPRMYFQRYPTEKEIDSFSTEEDARAYLNEYFTKTFPEEFLQFSTALVKKINWGS